MGVKAKRKQYLLKFAEDTPFPGLEVTMGSVSMGVLLEIQAVTDRGAEAAKDMTAFHKMVEILAGALKSWNLDDDDDQPVPTTAAGVLTLDIDEIMLLVGEWTKAIAGVSDPLGDGSTSGGPSPEASIPMEPVSLSLVS